MMFGLATAVAFLLIFVVEYVRGKRKSKELGREQYANAATWGIFLILSVAGHVHKPDDPSILITCGAGMQLLASALLWAAPRRNGAPETAKRAPTEFGVLAAFAIAVRLVVTCQYNGYLPVDATGDGCIQVLEATTLLLTLHGLFYEPGAGYRISHLEWASLRRASWAICACVAAGLICFGDLNRNSGADEAYAMSIYMELMSWFFFFAFVWGPGREGVNAMGLLPASVQAMCRSYFWYMALNETRVREPRPYTLQPYFNVVLLASHLGMAILCGVMSSFCIHEFNVSSPHALLLELSAAASSPV